MIEREIKLRAWPGFSLPDLDGVAPGAHTRRRETIDLDATYFDTSDLRLARSDMTLRHRRRGARETWTLKLPSDVPGMQGGLSRHEVDERGSIDEVPPVLRLLVAAHVRSAPLERVARLSTVRRRTVVEGPDERLLAELDDDEVSVMDGGRVAARFREVEVELAPDAPTTVGEALVARLCRAGAEIAAPRPKVAQALGPRADEPPDVDVVALPDHPTAADAVTAAIRASVKRIIDHHPIAVLGDDPEGVHQMRVGARRLRSDLRTFRPLLDRTQTDPLRDELRELGNLLGAVRDPDVLGDRLRASADTVLASDAREALEAVLARLDADRRRAVDRLYLGLATDRYVALLDALVSLAAAPPLRDAARRPADEVLPGLVRKPWKTLRNLVADLPDDPADEELHEIRKRAKQVRYAAEAVAPALGKRARRAAKGVAAVQDVLGDHQDTVVAEQWLHAGASKPGTDIPTAFTLGALVADERVQRAELRALWPARLARRLASEAVALAEVMGPEDNDTDTDIEVRAAGGVVRRAGSDGVAMVVLVHRPRYDDWSLPKGKVDGDETEEECAVREVEEETGLRCRLGPELASTRYVDRKGRAKRVRYWLMDILAESVFTPNDEVDEVRWVPVEDAGSLLSYSHDVLLLEDLPRHPPAV